MGPLSRLCNLRWFQVWYQSKSKRYSHGNKNRLWQQCCDIFVFTSRHDEVRVGVDTDSGTNSQSNSGKQRWWKINLWKSKRDHYRSKQVCPYLKGRVLRQTIYYQRYGTLPPATTIIMTAASINYALAQGCWDDFVKCEDGWKCWTQIPTSRSWLAIICMMPRNLSWGLYFGLMAQPVSFLSTWFASKLEYKVALSSC